MIGSTGNPFMVFKTHVGEDPLNLLKLILDLDRVMITIIYGLFLAPKALINMFSDLRRDGYNCRLIQTHQLLMLGLLHGLPKSWHFFLCD